MSTRVPIPLLLAHGVVKAALTISVSIIFVGFFCYSNLNSFAAMLLNLKTAFSVSNKGFFVVFSSLLFFCSANLAAFCIFVVTLFLRGVKCWL